MPHPIVAAENQRNSFFHNHLCLDNMLLVQAGNVVDRQHVR